MNRVNKIIFLIALCMVLHTQGESYARDTTYILTGRVRNLKNGEVTIEYETKNGKKGQTVPVKNHQFTFKGSLTEPVHAIIYFDYPADINKEEELFLDIGTTNISLLNNSVKSLKLVKGSALQYEFQDLISRKRNMHVQLSHLFDLQRKNNSRKIMDSISVVYGMLQQKLAEIDSLYIVRHPQTILSAWLITKNLVSEKFSLYPVDPYYHRLSSSVKNSYYGQFIFRKMQKSFSTAPGQPAISFVAKDITGQPLNPDSLRGKYVLLNFWASWCVVCRKDNKILNDYFNAYHQKGLEIIGIATNDKKEDWEKAIIADNTNSWHHVFDDKDSGIAEKYDVHGLPVDILIDDKGKIIGRYTGANQGYYSFSSNDIFRKLYDIFKDK